MGQNTDSVRHLPNFCEQEDKNLQWKKVKLLFGNCFNFSCEGNVLLDDENISYIEESPEVKSEASHSGTVSEFPCSESVVCGNENSLGTLSCIMSPEIHASNNMTQDGSPIEWETNKLFPYIKKQSCKNYSSFESSPPIEGLIDTKEASGGPSGLLTAGDELRPLAVKHNSLSYKNTDIVTNEHNCFGKKDKFYNKVLPFPIVSKSFSSQEYPGAVNSLVQFDDDTNSHSVSINYGKDVECKGNNFSIFQKPVVAKDTMILCNDLDSDCQVIPLSFSPNVHPDMGSVPINYQVSINNSVPPGTLVSSSCNSNSFVTVLNQTKDSIHPASWPRRRPQSLRVAMCYSDPEHLQANVESQSSAANLQEIALEDMTGIPVVEGLSPANVLSCIINSKNKEVQEESNTEKSVNRNVETERPPLEMFEKDNENRSVTKHGKPDSAVMNMFPCNDSVFKAPDISKGSLASAETVLRSSALFCPLLNATQNSDKLEDGALMSPSSDKENDPTMISVRPKIKNFSNSHSPKRKKTSPLRKTRSPRKHRPDSIKEIHPKSLPAQSSESIGTGNIKACVREEDVWAVDDFLPVSRSYQTQHLEQQNCNLNLSPTTAVKTSVSGVETICGSKSETFKGSTTPFLDDVDFSMINSTFSTDTGYETETNTNSVSAEDCIAQQKEAVKSDETQSFHLVAGGNSVTENLSTLPFVPSAHTTPVNLSGTTTPNTVTEDLTDYYSICSELANLVNVSSSISCHKEAGEDTADYLSISSEMPGVSKLPEDSPCADLVVQQDLVEGVKDAESSGDLRTPNQTFKNSEAVLTNEECLTSVEDPGVEEAVCPPEDVSGEHSPSNSSTHSPVDTPSQEIVEIKYMQLSLSIVLAIVLHAMQSISQFMLEIFLATEQEDRWD